MQAPCEDRRRSYAEMEPATSVNRAFLTRPVAAEVTPHRAVSRGNWLIAFAGPAATPETWSRLADYSERALHWDPDDPQLLQTAGALHWWGAWINSNDSVRSDELLQHALDYYRRAVRERPAWPDAWIDLAYAKYWRGDWDDEFQYAYEMAWRNGSWRRQVIFKAVELGFDTRQRLTPDNRERFYMALARAAARDSGWVRLMAKEKGGTFILCLALRNHQPTREYCARLGYNLNG